MAMPLLIQLQQHERNKQRRLQSLAVCIYDKKMKSFPSVIFAKLFGCDEIARFKADSGAEKKPNVGESFRKK